MSKRNEMESALRSYSRQNSHAAMRELLMRVAGVNVASAVSDDKIGAVLEALARRDVKAGAASAPDWDSVTRDAYASWNKNWKRPARRDVSS